MRKSAAGFTLIEAMISIAILAIILPTTFHFFSLFQWFSHEENYKYALFQAESHIEALQAAPFEDISPEVRAVPADGVIRLRRPFIVPGSLKVYEEGAEIPSMDINISGGTSPLIGSLPDVPIDLRLSRNHAGRQVVIEYQYHLPHIREAATVPESAPFSITLINAPVTKIIAVRAASGSGLVPLDGRRFSVDCPRGVVTFDRSLGGKVVEFTYLGEKTACVVSAAFMDGNLEVTHLPSRLKRVAIEEIYGQRLNRFKLSFIRAAK